MSAIFSGTEADMRVAKESFGVAGWMCLFVDKEDATNLVGDITEEMLVAATCTLVAEFTVTVEMTKIFLHGILPCKLTLEDFMPHIL